MKTRQTCVAKYTLRVKRPLRPHRLWHKVCPKAVLMKTEACSFTVAGIVPCCVHNIKHDRKTGEDQTETAERLISNVCINWSFASCSKQESRHKKLGLCCCQEVLMMLMGGNVKKKRCSGWQRLLSRVCFSHLRCHSAFLVNIIRRHGSSLFHTKELRCGKSSSF
jgi:hypothetical protein